MTRKFKIRLNMAYLTWGAPSPYMGPPPFLASTWFFSCLAVGDNLCRSPYTGSVFENHTHVKPITSKGAVLSAAR